MHKILWILLIVLSSCNHDENRLGLGEQMVALNIKLIDAPNDELKNVFVNIDHIELRVYKSGITQKFILGTQIGTLDLLTLRDGKSLNISDLILPADAEVEEVRLVLKETGNYTVDNNNEFCNLKTPSAQASGVKVKIKNAILEAGFDYRLTLDFDALNSIVTSGTGDCLLNPVFKIASLERENPEIENDPPEEIILITEEGPA